MDGSKDVGTDGDTNWYFIDDGDIIAASNVVGGTDYATYNPVDSKNIFVKRKKIKVSKNKYFAFNEKGQMRDGLQYVKADGGFYFFDENGYQKTGKVASVECDDDDYTFYFTTTNGKNGLGYTGEKDGYLYFNGKRLEADDDYRFYYVEGKVYLVNSKGKIQKATGASGKKYDDIENPDYSGAENIVVTTNKNGVVESIDGWAYNKVDKNGKLGKDYIADKLSSKNFDPTEDTDWVTIPSIELYDTIYTYTYDATNKKIIESWK